MSRVNHIFPIGLAPMEGVTEFPFRLWMHWCGQPDFLSTPFLRVTETFPLSGKPPAAFAPELRELVEVIPYTLIPQIMASDPKDFLRTAPYFLETAAYVDLNCGCPSPKCAQKGAGSSLLKRTKPFRQFVKRLSDALPGRVGVKMRTGFYDATMFDGLIECLAGLPLYRVTIHGRTKAERYSGRADWHLIDAAANHLAVPVFGSGDIVSAEGFRSTRQGARRVGGAIVGRGALRNPWIFRELRSGQKVQITPRVLATALEVFALWNQCYLDDFDKALDLASDEVFLRTAGTDLDVWLMKREMLRRTDLKVSRRCLGRLKLIWSYLRSSLPSRYEDPSPLRQKSLGEFLDAVDQIGEPAILTLRHKNRWDARFSGRPNAPHADHPSKHPARPS